MRLWLKIGLAVLAVGLLLTMAGLGAVALWPRAAAESIASHLLQRRVTLAELSIHWGDPLRIRLRDLTLANPDGLQSTHMITIAALEAEVDRKALFEGRVVYRHLHIDRPVVVLERDAAGTGNWHFGSGSTGAKPQGGLALVPKNRTQFPSLLDMKLTGGMVRYRASSGQWLSIPLDDLTIQAQTEDAPVTLTLDGGYNDTDAQLSATTASFNTLRDAAIPFDAGFGIVTPGARLDFKGVIDEPLDFEGVQGRLSLEAPKLDALLALFKSAIGLADVPLRLAGGFSHTGEQWELDGLSGDLGGNAFEGGLTLHEGARGRSDRIRAVLQFARLDLAKLLPPGNAKGGDWRGAKLSPPTAPDTAQVDLQVSAQRFVYAPWQAADLTFAATLEPGRIDIERLAAQIADGEIVLQTTMTALPGGADGRLVLAARIAHANADRLLSMLGLPGGQLAGPLDLQTSFSAQGPTLGQAMKTAQGQTVLALQDGRIARALIELVSADLRTLFRHKDESTGLRCLLAVVDLKNGQGRIAPLTLRSDGGTIRGAGSLNLVEPKIDLLIRSDPKTTGSFALDIPLRLSGPLDGSGLKAVPERNAALPDLSLPALKGEMAALAQKNPCWR